MLGIVCKGKKPLIFFKLKSPSHNKSTGFAAKRMTINQPDAQNNFETTVLSELRQINQRLDDLETDVSNLKLNLEKVDYKFDTYQKASDSMVRLATTIIVAAATVAVLPSALSAISPLINALVTGVGSGS